MDANHRITALGDAVGTSVSFAYTGGLLTTVTDERSNRTVSYTYNAGGYLTSMDMMMDGANWYIYCAGNPVLFIDPSGFEIIVYPNGKMVDRASGSELWNSHINGQTPREDIVIREGTKPMVIPTSPQTTTQTPKKDSSASDIAGARVPIWLAVRWRSLMSIMVQTFRAQMILDS